MDTVFAVGLKSPNTPRGFHNGYWLIARGDFQAFRGLLLSDTTVRARSVAEQISQYIPSIRVKVPTPKALAALRRLPFVDYVEPALIPSHLLGSASFGGCGNPYGDPGQYTTQIGDALPRTFVEMGIDRAWAYSDGRYVWLSVLDTGVNPGNPELRLWFVGGQSNLRQDHVHVNITGQYDAQCEHGTFMAGVAAAPRNSGNAVGVAWNANLLSVQMENGVVNWGGGDPASGLAAAFAYNVDVIMMAWGVIDEFFISGAVSDLIKYGYQQKDIVFVGAAGTSAADLPIKHIVAFPARMSEVFAVSAADYNGQRDNQSHYGSQLDAVAYHPTTTTNWDASGLRAFANSSSATAVIGGVAGLIRSRYPSMTNSQVISRILSTAGTNCGKEGVLFGPIINAEAAVGGMCVRFARPLGPTTIVFDRAVYGDTRTQTTQQYCIQASGGASPLVISWGNGSNATCSNVTFQRGTYTQRVQANVRDPGVALPARTFYVDVSVVDLDNNPNCPECVLREAPPRSSSYGVRRNRAQN